MLSFFSKQKNALGLDISDTMMRIMQLESHDSRSFPNAFAETPVPKGIVIDGQVKNSEQFSKILQHSIKHPAFGRFTSSYVVLSVPDSKSFVRVITVPKMNEKDAEEAVPLEAEQYIPVSSDSVYMDFEILDDSSLRDSDKMKVVITATPKDLVDQYVELAKSAGLKPVAVEVESKAVARCLIEKKNQVPTLILDMSAIRSNLIIYDNRSLQFTSSLPVAGNILTAQIAQKLTISPEEAEKLKRQVGLYSKKDGGRVSEAIVPQLHSIAEAVKNAINFYREHSDNSREIGKILLCGGSSKLKKFPEFLNKELQGFNKKTAITVNTGDPWVNVLGGDIAKVPPISKSDSMSFTTVIGLALRGIKRE